MWEHTDMSMWTSLDAGKGASIKVPPPLRDKKPGNEGINQERGPLGINDSSERPWQQTHKRESNR